MNNNGIKSVVATGIGAALFVVIGMINIPLFINTSIQLQYAVQAFLSVVYGPIVGLLVGLIGHAVKDGVQYGSLWWTWIVASGLFGLIVGLFKNYFKIEEGGLTTAKLVIFNVIQIVANILVWGVFAPSGDVLVYSEPAAKTFTQGVISAGVNSLTVAVGGTIILLAYARTRVKAGTLKKG